MSRLRDRQGRLRRRWETLLGDLVTRLRGSLRARVTLGITLPILVALLGLSGWYYWREQHLIEEQAGLTGLPATQGAYAEDTDGG